MVSEAAFQCLHNMIKPKDPAIYTTVWQIYGELWFHGLILNNMNKQPYKNHKLYQNHDECELKQ